MMKIPHQVIISERKKDAETNTVKKKLEPRKDKLK